MDPQAPCTAIEARFEETPMRQFVHLVAAVRTSDRIDRPDAPLKPVAFPAEFLQSKEHPPRYHKYLPSPPPPPPPPPTHNCAQISRKDVTAVLGLRDEQKAASVSSTEYRTPVSPSHSSSAPPHRHESSRSSVSANKVVYANINTKHVASSRPPRRLEGRKQNPVHATVGARISVVDAGFPCTYGSVLNKVVIEETFLRQEILREHGQQVRATCEAAIIHWNANVSPNILFTKGESSRDDNIGMRRLTPSRLYSLLSTTHDVVREIVVEDEERSRRLYIIIPHQRVLGAYLNNVKLEECLLTEQRERTCIEQAYFLDAPLWELFSGTYMMMLAETVLETKTRGSLLVAEEISREEVRARTAIVLAYMGCSQVTCLNCSRMFSQVYATVESDMRLEKLRAERRAQKERWLKQLQKQQVISDRQHTQRIAAIEHVSSRRASLALSQATTPPLSPESHPVSNPFAGLAAAWESHPLEQATDKPLADGVEAPPPLNAVFAPIPITPDHNHMTSMSALMRDDPGAYSVAGLSMVPGSVIQRTVGKMRKRSGYDATMGAASVLQAEDDSDEEYLLSGNTNDATIDRLSVEYIDRFRWTMMNSHEKRAATEAHCFPPELITINLGLTAADARDQKRAARKEAELASERGHLQPHQVSEPPYLSNVPTNFIAFGGGGGESSFSGNTAPTSDALHQQTLDGGDPLSADIGASSPASRRDSAVDVQGELLSVSSSRRSTTDENCYGKQAEHNVTGSLLTVPEKPRRRRRGSGQQRPSTTSIQSAKTDGSSDMDIPELTATRVPRAARPIHNVLGEEDDDRTFTMADGSSAASVGGKPAGDGTSSLAVTSESPTLSAFSESDMGDDEATQHPHPDEDNEDELTPFGSDMLEESQAKDRAPSRTKSKASSLAISENSLAEVDTFGFAGDSMSFGGGGDSSFSVHHSARGKATETAGNVDRSSLPSLPRAPGDSGSSPSIGPPPPNKRGTLPATTAAPMGVGSTITLSSSEDGVMDPFADDSSSLDVYPALQQNRPGSAGKPPLPSKGSLRRNNLSNSGGSRSVSPGLNGSTTNSTGGGINDALTPFSNELLFNEDDEEDEEDTTSSTAFSVFGASKASSFGSLGSRSATPAALPSRRGSTFPMASSLRQVGSTGSPSTSSVRRVSIVLPPKPPAVPYSSHPIFKNAISRGFGRRRSRRSTFVVDVERIQSTDLRIRKYRIKRHFKQLQAERDDELVPANLFRASLPTCRLSNLMDLYYTSVFIESAAAEVKVFTNVALKITAAWAEALRNRNIARLKFLQQVVDRVQNTINEKVAAAATTEELVQNFLAMDSDDPWEHLLWDEVIQRARSTDTCFEERGQMQKAFFDRERYNLARQHWFQFEKLGWKYEDEVTAYCELTKVVEREEEQRIRILSEEALWRVVPVGVPLQPKNSNLPQQVMNRVGKEGLQALRSLQAADVILLDLPAIERRLITTDERYVEPSLSGNRPDSRLPLRPRKEQVFLSMFVFGGCDRLAGGRLIPVPPLTYEEEIEAAFSDPFLPTPVQSDEDEGINTLPLVTVESVGDVTNNSTTASLTLASSVTTKPQKALKHLIIEFSNHAPHRFVSTVYAALGLLALEDLRRRTIEGFDTHIRDSIASFHRWSCNTIAPHLLIREIENARLLQSFTLLDVRERTKIFREEEQVRRTCLGPCSTLLSRQMLRWRGIVVAEQNERELLKLIACPPSEMERRPTCESMSRHAVAAEEGRQWAALQRMVPKRTKPSHILALAPPSRTSLSSGEVFSVAAAVGGDVVSDVKLIIATSLYSPCTRIGEALSMERILALLD